MKTAAANSLVQALMWRLREMRIRVGVFELEQAVAVLSTQADWTKEDLQRVLLPIFCKRHEHRAVISALIEELVAPPPPVPGPVEDKQVITETRESGPRPIIPDRRSNKLLNRLRRFFLARPKTTSWLLYLPPVAFLVAALVVLFPSGFSSLWDRLDLIARSVTGAIMDPLGGDLISVSEDREGLELALWIRHGTVAALTASSAVAVLLIFALRQKSAQKTQEKNGPEPITIESGDASVFRVGSLGGPPRSFLTPQLATEITELLNYRQTERDLRDLNLRATVDRRVRGDMDSLIFEKRKELPTVIILADTAGGAHSWNTLAAEFQTALERRGLVVETFTYSSSFSETSQSVASYQGNTISSALETLAQDAGWMLTTVFGDLRRMSNRDASLLASLHEQGPVLVFDYNDPQLWDHRHEALQSLGLTPHPATGRSLRQALAASFAPDRAALRQVWSVKSDETVIEHLSEAHAQWASACATVEPISFALAEKLRHAHPQLAREAEELAFSLLVRLPGSWMGPEGLRFSPQMRRRLLSRTSAIPRDQQFAFLKVLDEAFGAEPSAITAGELWRYARAQAELFTPRQSRALQDLADIKASALIDQVQFDDFAQRLRLPGEVMQSGTIALPMRSSRVFTIAGRREAHDPSGSGRDTISSKWSLGLSEARIRLTSADAPLVAFLPGGRNILVVEAAANEPFTTVDTVRGTRVPLNQDDPYANPKKDAAGFVQLMVFQDSQTAIAVTPNGKLFSILQSGNGDQPTPDLSLKEIPLQIGISGAPLLALSATGTRIACCSFRSSVVALTDVNGEERPLEFKVPGNITALAFSQAGTLLCGLENGEVYSLADPLHNANAPPGSYQLSDFDEPRRIASFGTEIAALTEIAVSNHTQETIVAALSDGQIMLNDGAPSKGTVLTLPWRPKWLTAFPERKAALVSNTPVGFSVAVTGPAGEFDVVGLPLYDERYQYQGESLIDEASDPARDGIAVLAVNAERRRVVVHNGLYLEIRPLLYDLPEAADDDLGARVEEAPSSGVQKPLDYTAEETAQP